MSFSLLVTGALRRSVSVVRVLFGVTAGGGASQDVPVVQTVRGRRAPLSHPEGRSTQLGDGGAAAGDDRNRASLRVRPLRVERDVEVPEHGRGEVFGPHLAALDLPAACVGAPHDATVRTAPATSGEGTETRLTKRSTDAK